MTKLPAIDRQRFISVRSYYFREELATWQQRTLDNVCLETFRQLHRMAHIKALDWCQRRYF